MSDKALSTLLTALMLAALAVWIPLLEAFAWLKRQSSPMVPLRQADPAPGEGRK